MTDENVFRFASMAMLAPVISVAAYHRIRAHTGETLDRRQEGVTLAVALRLCGLGMWAAIFAYMIRPSWMSWAQVELPEWLRWSGLALGLLGAPLVYWQMHSLGSNLTDTVVTRANATLVTQGPYRWVDRKSVV